MKVSSPNFKQNAQHALKDKQLQGALRHVRNNFTSKRAKARLDLPEFDDLRDNARAIKDHTLEHLDFYLEHYEKKVIESGGKVHWAEDAAEARGIIMDICRKSNARTVTKGKSMISEEINLNEFLEANSIVPVETDLGEYIIQLRGESPSHIIAPAVHLNIDQVRDEFRKAHTHLSANRPMAEPETLLREAREVLRKKFLVADLGITGANFLVAETGSSLIVTNEGNGDLTQILPRVHVVLASIEKIVPTLEDLSQITRLLARSATGQEITVYSTLSTGPRRKEDVDGPEEYHVVLLDNGRSSMLGTEFSEMLRCIRCGACMNHCPVYQAVGGHAYGWVYPGPMGAVLTPSLIGVEKAGHLPNASTFCGRCEAVCPMRIPLPKMMRSWREREFERHLVPPAYRRNIALWAWFAKHRILYRFVTAWAARILAIWGGSSKRISKIPMAEGWTKHRILPAPEGTTFMKLYKRRLRRSR